MLLLLCLGLGFIAVLLTPLTIYAGDYMVKGTDIVKLLHIIPWAALIYYEFRKPRPGRRMARAVASRRERLFTPNASTTTLLVQPLESYGRFKSSKQFAMARVRPDGLDLEFGKFRARLSAADIQLDLVKAIDRTMLVLNAHFAKGSWRIVIDDVTPKSAKDPTTRAQTLKSRWESAFQIRDSFVS